MVLTILGIVNALALLAVEKPEVILTAARTDQISNVVNSLEGVLSPHFKIQSIDTNQ